MPKKTEELPPLKGYEMTDIPDPEKTPISADAKAVTIAILAVATELRLNRISLENSAGFKLQEIALKQLEAQMGGGIVGATIIPGSGH